MKHRILLLALCAGFSGPSPAAERPNILLAFRDLVR